MTRLRLTQYGRQSVITPNPPPRKTTVFFWGGSALPCPCPALRCPALPRPALCPALPYPALPCPALPALPLRCRALRATLAVFVIERPAQAARTHNPTPIHLSSAFLCNVVIYVSNSERKQRARKPPLRGVWGVNPKP